MSATLTAEQKQSIEDIAYRTLLLNVTDNVLQVIDETNAYDVWNHLQALRTKDT